jgi:hypothetical protein
MRNARRIAAATVSACFLAADTSGTPRGKALESTSSNFGAQRPQAKVQMALAKGGKRLEAAGLRAKTPLISGLLGGLTSSTSSKTAKDPVAQLDRASDS